MVIVVIFIMFGVLMVVEAARQMIVVLFLPGMAVHKAMGMLVLVLVHVLMHLLSVDVGVGMQVTVQMVVLVFVLQR